MKKAFITICKFILFFIGWAICSSVFEIPSENPVIWRFWAELVPMFVVILFSIIFWLVEKREIKIAPVDKPMINISLGIGIGCIWLGLAVGILCFLGVIDFTGKNIINNLWLWIISCFLNVIMQELLVRGYLYQLLKKNYNMVVSGIITTLVFTLCHGGAFEAGVIPVLNIITMSIFMTLVLEYTKSIIAPIMIHFVWNSIGAIILGGVSLADDYPVLLQTVYNGNRILTGGGCKIEGSIVVLLLNCLFISIFVVLLKNRSSAISYKSI